MVDAPAAMFSSPASRPCSLLRNSASRFSSPSTSGRASSYSAAPAGVSCVRLPLRSTSSVPSSFSSAASCSDTEGCDRNSASAAREIVPRRAV